MVQWELSHDFSRAAHHVGTLCFLIKLKNQDTQVRQDGRFSLIKSWSTRIVLSTCHRITGCPIIARPQTA